MLSNNNFKLTNINTNILFNGFYQFQEISNYREIIKKFYKIIQNILFIIIHIMNLKLVVLLINQLI